MNKKWHIHAYKDKHSKRILTLCNNEALANAARNRTSSQYLEKREPIYVDGTFGLGDAFLKRASNLWEIHSVKRETDGEVFTVGDVVTNPVSMQEVTITKIEMHKDAPDKIMMITTPIIYMSNGGFIYGYNESEGYFWDVKKVK